MAKTKDISGFEESNKASSPKGKNYLLAIAIDAYDEEKKGIPRLSNCVKDAKDLIKVLKQRFGFQKAQVMTIFNEEATLENINEKLDGLTELVKEEDNVLIYFSGHGYYKKSQKEGYLIPVDGKRNAYWNYLSNANFLTHIRAIKSFHTFLIIDSCFSGSLFSTKDVSYAYSDRAASFPSRWGLAAGRIETVSDGYHGENSPFAKSIITFLGKTNALKNPVSALIQHVKTTTARNSDQTPIGGPLFKVGDMNGEFVFEITGGSVNLEENGVSENTQKSKDREELMVSMKNVLHEKLWEIKQGEIWSQVKKNNYGALDKFINEHPNSPYVSEAKILIEKLKKANQVINSSPSAVVSPNQPIYDIFIDPRDGQQYKTVKLKDGKIWMAENLNYNVGEGCSFYENKEENGKLYGRLYTWDAPLKACPAGWHLASDEEWKNLAAAYGGYYDYETRKDKEDPKSGYTALISGGNSGFTALLGGRRHIDGSYNGLGKYGGYWSSSEKSSDHAWFYVFYEQYSELRRGNSNKRAGRSCRCVKD